MIESHTLNIAIIGLSLTKLNHLKEYIRSIIPADYSINWAAITQPNIHLLMIDNYFFDTPSIQKVIAHQQSPVLKLMSKPELSGLLQNKELYLPADASSMFKHWLEETLLGQAPADKVLGSTTSTQVEPDLIPFTNPAAATVTVPEQAVSQHIIPQHISLDVFKQLLNPQHGKIFVFDQRQTFGIADTRKELVWLQQPAAKSAFKTDNTLNYTHAKANEVVGLHEVQAMDLRQWLWRLVWQSPAFEQLVKASDYLQLEFWPQPDESYERRDILKMAACFQQGAQVNQVAAKLDIPVSRVCQFASACLAAGLARSIPASQAKFQHNVPGNEQTSGLRGFFGKLRKRLGI